MADAPNPFDALIDTQRRTIEQSTTALHQSVEMGTRANEMALTSLNSTRSVQQRGMELAQSTTKASIDAMGPVSGGEMRMDGFQEMIDDQFETANEINDETWNVIHEMMTQTSEASEEIAELYLALVDASSEATLHALETLESATVDPGDWMIGPRSSRD